jgi:hypothetical protein
MIDKMKAIKQGVKDSIFSVESDLMEMLLLGELHSLMSNRCSLTDDYTPSNDELDLYLDVVTNYGRELKNISWDERNLLNRVSNKVLLTKEPREIELNSHKYAIEHEDGRCVIKIDGIKLDHRLRVIESQTLLSIEHNNNTTSIILLKKPLTLINGYKLIAYTGFMEGYYLNNDDDVFMVNYGTSKVIDREKMKEQTLMFLEEHILENVKKHK